MYSSQEIFFQLLFLVATLSSVTKTSEISIDSHSTSTASKLNPLSSSIKQQQQVADPLPLTNPRSESYVGQRQKNNDKILEADNVDDDDDNNNNLIWKYLNSAEQHASTPLNKHCTIYYSLGKIICTQLELKNDLPNYSPDFINIEHGVFLNTSSTTQIKLYDLKILFPNLASLSITQSVIDHNHNNLLNEIFLLEDEGEYENRIPGVKYSNNNTYKIHNNNNNNISLQVQNKNASYYNNNNKYNKSSKRKITLWPSIKILNLSNNNFDENIDISDFGHIKEYNSISISKILTVFPNLEQLELKGNRITTLRNLTRQNQLKAIDISDNPLDCTTDEIKWLESSNITLLNLEDTLCDRPPHQNKPKPILQTIHLIKKVQEECRVNCSCEIDYIWEQEKVIHSKTSVNCSNRNFIDFPDPDKLPNPTDTLYLNDNHIQSMRKFVDDNRYTALNVVNLYLDNNEITSLNELEQSDWIYNFQILSLRRNNLTQVRVHLLENIIRLNKRVYQIDLSDNNWKCECRTLSTFKIWLLQHYKFVKNIGNVRCGRTGREIRYLRNEDWCEMEVTRPTFETLDILNILMASLIVIIIGKVMYDYWNFSRHGKVPWLVGKIW